MGTMPADAAHVSWSKADTKRALVRIALFFVVILGSHWLFQGLPPFGAHSFFWNLALGALTAWVLVRLFLRRFDKNSRVGGRSLWPS